MTKQEHLLVCLAEEASEIVKEVTKILRFGYVSENDTERHTTLKGREVEPNGPRLEQEIVDIIAVIDLLHTEHEMFSILSDEFNLENKIDEKKKKVRDYMDKAREYKTLE